MKLVGWVIASKAVLGRCLHKGCWNKVASKEAGRAKPNDQFSTTSADAVCFRHLGLETDEFIKDVLT